MVAAALVIGLTVSVVSLVREQHARRQAQANELTMRRIAYAADMSLAQQALEMNDMGRAQQLLEAHRPAPGEVDLRGWEWRYLWQQCRSDALGVLCRYRGSAASVAYSPDGRVLAVAGAGPSFVDIWDVPGRERIKPLQPNEGSRVAFSPRGDLLATSAKDEIRLWRTGTWELVRQVPLAGGVMVLKFSPDGTRLAGLILPDRLTVWEVDQWNVSCRFSISLGPARLGNLDFSPDGKALVIGDADHNLRVIDLANGNTIFDVPEAHSEGITSVAWSPNDSVIASGSGWDGGPIRLWDVASGNSLGKLEGHTSWISDMVFSKDGLWLYSASGDQTLRIWDVEKQQCLATLRGSSHEVLGLALSPDGTTLASACKDGIVAFWSADPKSEEEMPRLIPLGHFAQTAFAPDSRVLAVPRARTVSLFDLATSKETELLPKMDTDVSAVAYSPDGTLLVSGGENGEIRVWSCAEHRLLPELDGHEEEICLLRFRADGTRLLSVDAKKTVIWWDVPTWQADRSFVVELPGRPDDVWRPPDVSPDGRLLVFGTKAGDVCWLDAETGELLERTTGGDYATKQVAFSGDGSQLASTSNHGTVALWDPSSFTRVTSFRAHLTAAHGVTFSPHDRRLATGGATSRDAVRLWDLSTHRELITLPGQAAVSSFVVFSNDGRWLAACSGVEGKLHLWGAPSWDEIEAEEKRLKSKQCP
jgi:WD40 repeat protein